VTKEFTPPRFTPRPRVQVPAANAFTTKPKAQQQAVNSRHPDAEAGSGHSLAGTAKIEAVVKEPPKNNLPQVWRLHPGAADSIRGEAQADV